MSNLIKIKEETKKSLDKMGGKSYGDKIKSLLSVDVGEGMFKELPSEDKPIIYSIYKDLQYKSDKTLPDHVSFIKEQLETDGQDTKLADIAFRMLLEDRKYYTIHHKG